MPGIFISYRREDAAGWAERLAADLRREFPASEEPARTDDHAHHRTGSQRPPHGVDKVLADLDRRDVLKDYARDEQGNRRLDDPDDWVRLEVAESLQRPGLRVVPVLVGGAPPCRRRPISPSHCGRSPGAMPTRSPTSAGTTTLGS